MQTSAIIHNCEYISFWSDKTESRLIEEILQIWSEITPFYIEHFYGSIS